MRLRILFKISAIVLVTLAVSPVTAPFVTCDLAATTNLHEFVVSAGKVAEEIPVLAPGLTLLASAQHLSLANPRSDAEILPALDSCNVVLRL